MSRLLVVGFGAVSVGFALAIVAFVGSYLFKIWLGLAIVCGLWGTYCKFAQREQIGHAQQAFAYGLIYLVAAGVSWLVRNTSAPVIVFALFLLLIGDLPTWRKFRQQEDQVKTWASYAMEGVLLAIGGAGAYLGLEFCRQAPGWVNLIATLAIIVALSIYGDKTPAEKAPSKQ
ncbi:hypothetical protein IJJ12_01390 [bacterium]|nr:hypothetical protein [bacterium]